MLGLAWRRGDAGPLATEESVDGGRLANVRVADEADDSLGTLLRQQLQQLFATHNVRVVLLRRLLDWHAQLGGPRRGSRCRRCRVLRVLRHPRLLLLTLQPGQLVPVASLGGLCHRLRPLKLGVQSLVLLTDLAGREEAHLHPLRGKVGSPRVTLRPTQQVSLVEQDEVCLAQLLANVHLEVLAAELLRISRVDNLHDQL
mmetsp:Transcript_492/g.1490  ORF Transcript_492/g.1490 Transcript_492/m.1490 type:complete len:200 (+) Transcript_492:637-1236(+)